MKGRIGGRVTHRVEEDVEAVRLAGVGPDDEDDGEGVDSARLGHDPRFPRETERLARVTHRALAGPEAIGDEHYTSCGQRWEQ